MGDSSGLAKPPPESRKEWASRDRSGHMPREGIALRGISLSMVFVVFSTCFIAAAAVLPGRARAATLYVGIGPGMYATIQSAIDAAAPGDTVYVYNGVYRENININKAISVVGQDQDQTIIDGRRMSRTVAMTADQATIAGFTLTNGAPGLTISGFNDCIVSNNIITDSSDGISISNGMRNIIANNVVTSNSNNGIWMSASNNNYISGNIASSNYQYGIYLTSSVGNTIEGNVASSNQKGIFLDQSSNNAVADNVALSNYYNYDPTGSGIWLRFSSSNVITGNNASSNYESGIRLERSSNNVVSGNRAFSNEFGIFLLSSSTNTLDSNLVSLNRQGLRLDFSNSNSVTGTSISSNSYRGIYLRSSGNNTIVESSISSNSYGGIELYLSDSNKVYHNNLIGNGVQANDDGSNEWDDGYPSGGNYWSNYAGIDAKSGPLQDLPGSDGIGDTLYYIPDGASVDHYPMMGPNVAPLSPPSQPLNLTTVSGDSQAILSWLPPTSDGGSPVTNYRIYRREKSGSMAFLLQIGNVLTYTDSGLKNGMEYYYGVSAANLIGEGLTSQLVNATPATVPSEPLGLAAVAESRLVTLTWMPPSSNGGAVVTNYRIYRGISPGGGTLLAEVGSVRQYLDIGLTNGQTYYYVLKAKNAVGEGPPSDEVGATPAAIITVPTAPIRLSASAGDGFANLTWNAPVDNGGSPVVNYSIYRGPYSGGEAFLVEIGNVFAYHDKGLTNGQTYYYKVSAKNSMGEGARSDSVSATPMTIPGPPLGVSVQTGDRQIELTWLAPIDDGGSAITHYTIYRATTPNDEAFLVAVGSGLSYTDTGVTNGVTYYYIVSASNSLGEGPMSSEVSGTPATPPPNQPPECAIVSPAPDATISERYAVIGTASDAGGAVDFVEVRVDGSGWTRAVGEISWSYDLDTTTFSNGRHTIYARSFDGEDYSTLATVTVNIINGGPPTSQTSLLQEAWFWALMFMIVVVGVLMVLLLRERRGKPKSPKKAPDQIAKAKAPPTKTVPPKTKPPAAAAPQKKEEPKQGT